MGYGLELKCSFLSGALEINLRHSSFAGHLTCFGPSPFIASQTYLRLLLHSLPTCLRGDKNLELLKTTDIIKSLVSSKLMRHKSSVLSRPYTHTFSSISLWSEGKSATDPSIFAKPWISHWAKREYISSQSCVLSIYLNNLIRCRRCSGISKGDGMSMS